MHRSAFRSIEPRIRRLPGLTLVPVDAKASLKRAIADTVVPLLRANAFKGTSPTWVRTNDRGDAAVVNVQQSPWNTREEVSFYVNLAVVPEPWRAWMAAKESKPVGRTVKEYDGLWRARLDPTPVVGGPPGSWRVTDASTAAAAARDVSRRLLDAGLPALERSMDRTTMLDALRDGTLNGIYRAGWESYRGKALVVLLADSGPSPELDSAIASLCARKEEVEGWPGELQLLQRWVEERAASRIL